MKMSPTPELRWVERIVARRMVLPNSKVTVETGEYDIKPVLQQKWLDISTGVHAWREVVTIKNED